MVFSMRFFLFCSLLFWAEGIFAQQHGQFDIESNSDNSVDVKEKSKSWLNKALKAAESFLDEMAISGVDTSYLALPKYGWKLAFSSNFAGIKTNVSGHDLPVYENIDVNMKSKLNGQASVAFGYRSASFKYSWDWAHGYSRDFNFSLLDNPVGIEIRNHTTDGMYGMLDASSSDGNMKVKKGDVTMKATIINAYYAFNAKKYSLPAAMDQSLIQKKSAGSITAYALFLSANMQANNRELINAMSTLKKIELYQAALGLGYGYNFTPNKGKFLLHVSAAPLLVFFNKSFLTGSMELPLFEEDEEVFELDMSAEVKTRHKMFLTAIARASLFYNINDHFYLGANALVNDVRFDSKDDIKMKMKDWIINAQIGIRF